MIFSVGCRLLRNGGASFYLMINSCFLVIRVNLLYCAKRGGNQEKNEPLDCLNCSHEGFAKLNTDGSFKRSSGLAGDGGGVRDAKGPGFGFCGKSG